MNIKGIAGFAVITETTEPSKALYRDVLQLPMKEKDDYLSMDRFEGANHFGVWPLRMAAQSCFDREEWPADLPKPQATIEFELSDIESVHAAVDEMKAAGQEFVHEARLEPWGQTIARFLSPEGILVGLSFAPWLHDAGA
ncbi:MAG TPA: VOC family protein [Gammaproteobacteria bacterium]|jgi:catechol 2,3-dioxygenase-like lactoylglutathione lyase family enzyme